MDAYEYHTPPRWWSPRLTLARFRFWKFMRRHVQQNYHHLMKIEIRGLENLTTCLSAGHGVMITPNHSSHADPSVVYGVADQLKIPFFFMATAQIFMRASWFRSLLLRHHGCFSVDREGPDIRAFRQAVGILRDERFPLVIFPEGEIYHINRHVTPFLDGPAAIALNAAKHADRPITLVPCGIRYHYLTNPMEELLELMNRLEERILWRPKRNLVLRKRIYQFAEAILGLKEKEYLGAPQPGSLPERIQSLAEHILRAIELKYEITNPAGTLPGRVKACRRAAIQDNENDELPIERRTEAATDLDDLFVVTQLFSYPGTYTTRKPSVEEMAEVLDKFEEDVLKARTAGVRASRRAILSFGPPIPVERGTGGKARTHALTEQLETSVQALLNELNEATVHACNRG